MTSSSECADTDAIILVGGQGTRLRPLTLTTAKPLLPVAGEPLLMHLVRRLRQAGIGRIVLSTSYRAETFVDALSPYVADGEITYVVEEEPLGTGGAIRNALDAVQAEDVLIFNGDVLSGVSIPQLVGAHRAAKADVTLHLTKVDDPSAYGCVPTGTDGAVLEFLEKHPQPVTNQINAGAYVFRRDVIAAIPAGRPVSVEREVFPGLLAAGAPVHGFVDASYWRDLGRPGDFIAGSADVVSGLVGPTSPSPEPAALVMPGADIAPSARVAGGSTVGAGSVIEADASVEATVLFEGVRVGARTTLTRCAIGRGVRIGADCELSDVVIGDGAVIGSDNQLSSHRLWSDARIADGALRASGN